MSVTYKTKQERKAEAKAAAAKKGVKNINAEDIVCAIYTRVSTKEQAEHYSLDYQVQQCKEFIKSKGWNPENIIAYQDPGFSGKSDKRPAFQKMIQDAKEGKFQILVVHKLDRFMRNMILCPQYLQEIVQNYHIPSYFFGDNLAFENEVEMTIQLAMFSWFADYYIKNLSNETAKGKKIKAEKGFTNGAAPFGYVKVDKEKMVIEPKEAEAVKMAFLSYSTGLYSDQDIAEMLNETGLKTKRGHIFSKDTVTGMLQNVVYAGFVIYTGIKAKEVKSIKMPGKHEPIITKELFEKCMAVRDQKNRNPMRDKHLGTPDVSDRYMLQGILVCAFCGRKMRVQSRRDHNDFRYIEGKSVKAEPCIYQKKSKPIISRIPEQQVTAIIDSLLLPDEWISVIQKEIDEKNEKSAIEGKISQIENRISSLIREYDSLSEFWSQEECDDNILKRKKAYDDLRILKTQQSQSAVMLDYSQILAQSLKDYFNKGTMKSKRFIIIEVFSKYAVGDCTYADLARLLNENGFVRRDGNPFSSRDVSRMIHTPFYAGYVVHGEKIGDGIQEAIISRELFEKCQRVGDERYMKMAKKKSNDLGDVSDRFMLHKLLICKDCGKRIALWTQKKPDSGKIYNYYSECNNPVTPSCKHRVVKTPSRIPEQQVTDLLCSIRIPDEWISSVLKEKSREFSVYDKEIERLERQVKALREKALSSDLSEEEHAAITEQRKNLYVQIRKKKSERKDPQEKIDMMQTILTSFSACMSGASMREKSEICHLIFTGIEFDIGARKVTAFTPAEDFRFLFEMIADENCWKIEDRNGQKFFILP